MEPVLSPTEDFTLDISHILPGWHGNYLATKDSPKKARGFGKTDPASRTCRILGGLQCATSLHKQLSSSSLDNAPTIYTFRSGRAAITHGPDWDCSTIGAI
ncbi:uncharacterized protein UV8b_05054 [Ustilaginoidea virens]|uniref:Uncharacterized protein n=1 Tax=Ustilaginoidea virens TaxID=1159556 RepID=A0A8E5HT19_USTVR|nr:uncharacterized protein UV8b_05054 [Ustilaginoidea virens]QUC20813.1 hypothetical protein UV8b_05054 [Ustilaginoidea virens]